MKLKFGNFVKDSQLIYQLKQIKNFVLSTESRIITERRIGDNKLQKLFQVIRLADDFSKYYKTEICDSFPINWIVRKKILGSKKTGVLVIFKIDFQNKKDLFNVIKYLRKNFELDISKDIANELVDELFNRLHEFNSDAMFQDFEGISTFSMMFLDKFKYSFDSFNHEFIHYYQWLTGDAIQKINLDFNTLEYPNNLELFFIDNSTIDSILKDILNPREFETYANIFINQVKKFIPNDLESAREFLKEYNKKNETNDEYLLRMYNSDFNKFLSRSHLNNIPFIIFMLNQIYRIHILYFQQHLTSYF